MAGKKDESPSKRALIYALQHARPSLVSQKQIPSPADGVPGGFKFHGVENPLGTIHLVPTVGGRAVTSVTL